MSSSPYRPAGPSSTGDPYDDPDDLD
jgi:hypothetical protein